MIYGYARVSTKTQAKDGNSLQGQIQTLKENGAKKIYSDSFTGTKLERPELTKLLDILINGDTLIVTKLDRFARSTIEGIEVIRGLLDKGIKVHVLNMGLIDNTPTGRLIMTIMLAFAEFERDNIIERTQEGKAIAKERGNFKDGRPRKQVDYAKYKKLVESGVITVTKACQELGISKSTWYNRIV